MVWSSGWTIAEEEVQDVLVETYSSLIKQAIQVALAELQSATNITVSEYSFSNKGVNLTWRSNVDNN